MRLKQRNTKEIAVPGDEDGAWIKIRALTINEIRRIDSKVNDIRMTVGENEESQTSVSFSPYDRTKMLAISCLVDWFGLFDAMDKEIPFKKINFDKVAAFEIEVNGEYIDFYSWVDSERVKFENELRAKKDKASKN
jgi:hypothetical protein